MSVRVLEGDMLVRVAEMPADSIDACVTDPPAGISFMGRAWDGDRGGRRQWVAWMTEVFTEVFRVLKPGAHGLVWALPRTSHWTAWALEDAGFEIRDCIYHLTGQGFPKSLDVSKAIDKAKRRDYVQAAVELGLSIPGNSLHDWTKAEHAPSDAWWEKFKAVLSADDWQAIERAVIAMTHRKNDRDAAVFKMGRMADDYPLTAPATAEATQWQGWGTALKPAAEEWILIRKPLAEKTVAANVLTYGTGALNIDATRIVGTMDGKWGGRQDSSIGFGGTDPAQFRTQQHADGRWPANVVLDEDAARLLDEQSGIRGGGLFSQSGARAPRDLAVYGGGTPTTTRHSPDNYGDTVGASRFYFCAKASSSERGSYNDHPTVKPLALMRWLVRLVTPAGGTVLDPFCGSGSTLIAADAEGFDAIGIDSDPHAVEISRRRVVDASPLFNTLTEATP